MIRAACRGRRTGAASSSLSGISCDPETMMQGKNLGESALDPAKAVYDQIVPAGEPWIYEISTWQYVRMIDVEGNQAADTLFFNAHDYEERYSAQETMRTQGNISLTTGTPLISSQGNVLLTIVADTCGRHDTLGGACAAESNQVRYAIDKKHMHNCRNTFLLTVAKWGNGYTKRDLTHNINFFMNVPVTPDGTLTFEDGVSDKGRYVELKAE